MCAGGGRAGGRFGICWNAACDHRRMSRNPGVSGDGLIATPEGVGFAHGDIRLVLGLVRGPGCFREALAIQDRRRLVGRSPNTGLGGRSAKHLFGAKFGSLDRGGLPGGSRMTGTLRTADQRQAPAGDYVWGLARAVFPESPTAPADEAE